MSARTWQRKRERDHTQKPVRNPFDELAESLGLFLLREGRNWKVYDRTTGRPVATVYGDRWRVLFHTAGAADASAADGYDALRKIAVAVKGSG
jgi:hypothetical protein